MHVARVPYDRLSQEGPFLETCETGIRTPATTLNKANKRYMSRLIEKRGNLKRV